MFAGVLMGVGSIAKAKEGSDTLWNRTTDWQRLRLQSVFHRNLETEEVLNTWNRPKTPDKLLDAFGYEEQYLTNGGKLRITELHVKIYEEVA